MNLEIRENGLATRRKQFEPGFVRFCPLSTTDDEVAIVYEDLHHTAIDQNAERNRWRGLWQCDDLFVDQKFLSIKPDDHGSPTVG